MTLRAELRELRGGPGASMSIPFPPEHRPVPQIVLFGGVPFGFDKIMHDGSILYLRRDDIRDVPVGTNVYTVPPGARVRRLGPVSYGDRK